MLVFKHLAVEEVILIAIDQRNANLWKVVDIIGKIHKRRGGQVSSLCAVLFER